MMKYILLVIILISKNAMGDEIHLKNGNTFEGNIISLSNKEVVFMPVFDEKSTNCLLTIKTNEINSFIDDNKYKEIGFINNPEDPELVIERKKEQYENKKRRADEKFLLALEEVKYRVLLEEKKNNSDINITNVSSSNSESSANLVRKTMRTLTGDNIINDK